MWFAFLFLQCYRFLHNYSLAYQVLLFHAKTFLINKGQSWYNKYSINNQKLPHYLVLQQQRQTDRMS